MNFEWRKMELADKLLFNKWNDGNDDNITKYVTSKHILLGDLLATILPDSSQTRVSIAESENVPVGVVMISQQKLKNGEKSPQIDTIVVDPKKAGNGIGKKMVDDIMKNPGEFFDDYPTEVFAIVERSNLASRRLFCSSGFKAEPTQDKYITYSKRTLEKGEERWK